jgi:hypothetical protein
VFFGIAAVAGYVVSATGSPLGLCLGQPSGSST